ncbi:MAG: CIA30 family protein [Pseudomonadota bacterium]
MLITDHTVATRDPGWLVVNDNVMGGRSKGGFSIDDGIVMFAGSTNTRGGGFSSIRSARMLLDLSAYDGVRLRIRGDGRRYTWRFTSDARYYGREVAYWADFETVDGQWQNIDIPFSAFIPTFRGAELRGPALNTANITGMGLMIYDKKDGAFSLRLDTVQAY